MLNNITILMHCPHVHSGLVLNYVFHQSMHLHFNPSKWWHVNHRSPLPLRLIYRPTSTWREGLHKVDAMEFAHKRAAASLRDVDQDSASAALLWKLLILLCRQNGVSGPEISRVDGSAAGKRYTPWLARETNRKTPPLAFLYDTNSPLCPASSK